PAIAGGSAADTAVTQSRIEFSLQAIEEESFVEDALTVPPAVVAGSIARDGSATITADRGTASVPNPQLPPLASAEKFTREVLVESLSSDIRPLGQLDDSFIIATDNEGLLLIDQHVAHERIL